eukprot:364097-Chlamydomonas_euryale.AAC.6
MSSIAYAPNPQLQMSNPKLNQKIHSSLELHHHVGLWRKPDARTQHVLEHAALLGERVDDGRAGRHKRRLGQVAQQHRDGVEAMEVLLAVLAQLDTRDELGEQHQVKDDGRRQQGVLARVVDHERVLAVHEDLARVLVHGTLGVANVGHVLDHDAVVGVLAVGVQQRVGLDHVVDDVGLGDLLGAERLRRRQVHACAGASGRHAA